MDTILGGILSRNELNTKLIYEICSEIGIKLITRFDFVQFLIVLQENNFRFSILEYDKPDYESIDQLKIIQKIRPKLPIIIISNEINQEIGGKLHEEGAYYLYLNPINRNIFQKIISGALDTYMNKDFKGKQYL